MTLLIRRIRRKVHSYQALLAKHTSSRRQRQRNVKQRVRRLNGFLNVLSSVASVTTPRTRNLNNGRNILHNSRNILNHSNGITRAQHTTKHLTHALSGLKLGTTRILGRVSPLNVVSRGCGYPKHLNSRKLIITRINRAIRHDLLTGACSKVRRRNTHQQYTAHHVRGHHALLINRHRKAIIIVAHRNAHKKAVLRHIRRHVTHDLSQVTTHVRDLNTGLLTRDPVPTVSLEDLCISIWFPSVVTRITAALHRATAHTHWCN